ncbi:hypothetical protein MASR1M12_03750 [Erysipelotrichia bacterium]
MSHNSKDNLMFDTMNLEGALFVPDLLEKAAQGKAADQSEAHYRLPKGLKIHDEYGRAFQIAQAQWRSFSADRQRGDRDLNKLSLTFVREFLADVLGYGDLEATPPVEQNQRHYPISFIAGAHIAVVAAPFDLDLDTPAPQFAVEGGGARKKSPFQLAQEFLNASSNHLWAIVCNGRRIRLLRDSATLTRPCFLEFDLETILGNSRYPDFTAMWRVLHRSRGGNTGQSPNLCIWEAWRKEGLDQGTRVREKLRDGVTQALLTLGSGFLSHPRNEKLRLDLHHGRLTSEQYFQQLLRLVYRWLLLFTVEERGILHPDDDSDAARRARQIYGEGYSQKRLRQRSIRHTGYDSHDDLWQAQLIVFRALTRGEPALALPALGGLFADDQCPDLDAAMLTNAAMLLAIRSLRWARAGNELSPVDYGNMGSEELGSVYESLLELVPTIDLPARQFGFIGITDLGSTDGNARKTSGSYYTPDCLVQELIKSALDPVIEARLAANPHRLVEALLEITVIDPACGSGHFLLSAARRLAEKLAALRSEDGAVRPADYRHALREVITHCIYGVDRNPMALELARTALWLEGFEPGRPLTFIDHHLVCGDALLGVMKIEQLRVGIPAKAFSALSGDDKEVCKALATRNRSGLKEAESLAGGNRDLPLNPEENDLNSRLAAIEALPDSTPEEIRAKRKAFQAFLLGAGTSSLKRAADLFVGAFLAEKSDPAQAELVPTTENLLHEMYQRFNSAPQQNIEQHRKILARCHELCREARVLHWPLAFPHIFARGGFDCVLANPPWERIKLQEEEFFASRNTAIAGARNKAERGKRIELLAEGRLAESLDPAAVIAGPQACAAEKRLYRDFIIARRTAEAGSVYAHLKADEGGRYPLTGVGDVNTYALFSEAITQMTSETGRGGFIVPSGIATDDSTKAYFSEIAGTGKLVSLFDFENREKLFPAVDSRVKFCLMTLGKAAETRFAFFMTNTEQLADTRRGFSLSPEDFALINPNTRTCPIFRSRRDAELTRKIYRRVPVLIKEPEDEGEEAETPAKTKAPAGPDKTGASENPWGIKFSTMFHMSNDSDLFLLKPEEDTLPLYEAKMIHQYDHRWATYVSDAEGKPVTADVSPEQKQNPEFRVTPRYWVRERHVLARLADVPEAFAKAYAAENHTGLLTALANWLAASLADEPTGGLFACGSLAAAGGPLLLALFTGPEKGWADKKQQKNAATCPLTEAERTELRSVTDLPSFAISLMRRRSPRWLMGWRDITNATNERTVIASVIPQVGVNHKMPLFRLFQSDPIKSSCLIGVFTSLTLDYVARQKTGGTSMSYFILKQLPIIHPDLIKNSDAAFIAPRVFELTYTASDMQQWAEDVINSATGEVRAAILQALQQNPAGRVSAGTTGSVFNQADLRPFPFNPERRALLRAELDAYYAMLYGLSRDDLVYILDPAEAMGEDYPSETFRVLKNNELKEFGEYRTRRLVLEAFDRLQKARDSQ